MTRPHLKPLRALAQAVRSLRRRPGLSFGFSALSCGTHLLGWALVAAGEGSESAVLTLLLRGVGTLIYVGSLIWLIEGLTRIGLSLGRGRTLRWRHLCRWHGRRSRNVGLGALNTAVVLGATAFATFMAWSLTLFLLPGLSMVPAGLGLIGLAGVGLSQLFNPCLVLDQKLSPTQAFTHGGTLLRQHWAGISGLAVVLLATLSAPFGLGLLTEALLPGFSAAATLVAMVAALPVLATTVTAAYLQLHTLRPGAR